MTVACPNCGKKVEEDGYVFGSELKTMCVTCSSCGTRLYLHVPSEGDKILGQFPKKTRVRHRTKFHCQVCKELIVRKRSEKDEIAAYIRHCKEKHPEMPEPHSFAYAHEDLTKREKDAIDYCNKLLRDFDEIVKEPEFQKMLSKQEKKS